MMSELRRKATPYFVLLLAVFFGFWQVSFLNGSLKWDLIDVVFPFRFYFSECIQSGFFPFWNPYLQTGTPFFADLQAPVFYPELLFTSLVGRYGILAMHFWFVVYLFIAATGMFRLSFYFNRNVNASLVAGMSYAFSGFIVGHGQHFFLLVGAAWIPNVITEYLQLAGKRSFFNTLKTAVFVFLMISGAYQALSFTLFYLLLSIFFYFLATDLAEKRIQEIKKWIGVNAMLLLILIIFSLPMIVATIEIITSVDRLEKGVTLAQTLAHEQTLKSVISFVFPFSTLRYDEFFGVDISMRNHYFGLIPLLFFVAALFKKQSRLMYLIMIFGVVIFSASFAFLPVREWLFRFVPLMNLFKYAAFLRVFGLLAFILVGANYLAFFLENIQSEKKKVLLVVSILMAGIIFLVAYSITKASPGDFLKLLVTETRAETLKSLNFYHHIFAQGIIQLLVLTSFLTIIFFKRKFANPGLLIAGLVFLELFIASQFNMKATVADSDWNPQKMNSELALFPDEFVVSANDKIIYNDPSGSVFPPFWRNTYVFSKQVAFDAFSSFELKSFSKLDDDFPHLKNAVLNNHLFYFSDNIFPMSEFNDATIDSITDSRKLFFSDADYEKLSKFKFETDSAATVKILEFLPTRVTVETETHKNQMMTMLQTSFKGWTATIDEEETPIYTSNFNYRSVCLPAGKHKVVFEYKNPRILWLYILSNLCFTLVVLFLLGIGIWKALPGNKLYIIIPAVLLLFILFLTVKNVLAEPKNLSVYDYYKQKWNVEEVVFKYQRKIVDEPANAGFKTGFLVGHENEFFILAEIPADSIRIKEGTLVVRSKFYPYNDLEALLVSEIAGENKKNTWHASKIERQIEAVNQWNNNIYFRNFYNLEKNDVIKVYVWNNKKSSFGIDSISVEIYPLPGK